MRIAGGNLKGRRLATPHGLATRPTSDKVRAAMFDVLAGRGIAVEGARVLDLFAGAGALGLEAISRGARFCLFIETSATARGVIRTNAESLGVGGLTKLWRRDATRLGRCEPMAPFDLVFADPPYGKGLGEQALASAIAGGWLAPGAVVIVEEAAQADLDLPGALSGIARRVYGQSAVWFAEHGTRRAAAS